MPNFITLKLHFKLITLKLLFITEDHVAIKQKNVIALSRQSSVEYMQS